MLDITSCDFGGDNSHLTRISEMIPEMYKGMRVAVVVPARNEERLIGRTIWPVPDAVDTIYVIDDGSEDRTAEVVRHYATSDHRIRLIHHHTNKGVGAAIITGYYHAYKDKHDVFVVVGGDAQMDWLDLDNLLRPIADGTADYAKGNRFIYGHSKNSPGNAWREMPMKRLFGNISLSILTKLASGYYHINDSQMGYTALHKRVLPLMDWTKARKGYGYPAEWLMRFHSLGVRVRDVPVRAIYLRNEKQTQIRVRRFIFYMFGIIIKGGLERLNREYLFGRVSLPEISMPTVGLQLIAFFRQLSLKIRSMKLPSWFPRVSDIRQQLGRARSIPKILSQRFGLDITLAPKQKASSLDIYTNLEKNNPLVFDIGLQANRILRKTSRMILESTFQSNYARNSHNDIQVAFENIGLKIRTRLAELDQQKAD